MLVWNGDVDVGPRFPPALHALRQRHASRIGRRHAIAAVARAFFALAGDERDRATCNPTARKLDKGLNWRRISHLKELRRVRREVCAAGHSPRRVSDIELNAGQNADDLPVGEGTTAGGEAGNLLCP
jgi:hypothetical protein